jgi:exopolysaccharide biosynthesis polyprenyl glycosylphosphotransferase
MTPQVAARLTVHEHEAVDPKPLVYRRRLRRTRLVPAPRIVHGAERSLPVLSRRETLHRRLLATADVTAATVSLYFVLSLLGSDQPGLGALAALPLVVVLFKVAGLYDRDQMRVVHSTLDEAPALVQLTGLYVLGVTILQPVVLRGGLSGAQIAALWAVSFLAIVGGRMIARWAAGRATPVERCLVIGERSRAARIRAKLASSRARAAVVATFPIGGGRDDIDPLDPHSVRRIVSDLQLDRIIIAPTTTDSGGVVELIRIAKSSGVQVSVLPRMLEVVGSAVEFEDIDGLTMMGVRPFGLPRSSQLLKRGFDLVATSLGLLAVSPLIAGLALAIRLDSKGPIFFRQIRVGRDGRQFRIFKFRSMVDGAEDQKDALRALNEVGEGEEGMFKVTDDPRVTRVGHFLRRTSLDELPQLFNVMRGEMSLVGPRPLVADEDAQVIGLDRSRLHLTPGMTGPWQVLGARVPMQEMVGIDYQYVASWSLWVDLKLLVRTARHVLRGGNV